MRQMLFSWYQLDDFVIIMERGLIPLILVENFILVTVMTSVKEETWLLQHPRGLLKETRPDFSLKMRTNFLECISRNNCSLTPGEPSCHFLWSVEVTIWKSVLSILWLRNFRFVIASKSLANKNSLKWKQETADQKASEPDRRSRLGFYFWLGCK